MSSELSCRGVGNQALRRQRRINTATYADRLLCRGKPTTRAEPACEHVSRTYRVASTFIPFAGTVYTHDLNLDRLCVVQPALVLSFCVFLDTVLTQLYMCVWVPCTKNTCGRAGIRRASGHICRLRRGAAHTGTRVARVQRVFGCDPPHATTYLTAATQPHLQTRHAYFRQRLCPSSRPPDDAARCSACGTPLRDFCSMRASSRATSPSDGVSSVKETPVAPARPVRPMRWT